MKEGKVQNEPGIFWGGKKIRKHSKTEKNTGTRLHRSSWQNSDNLGIKIITVKTYNTTELKKNP